MQDTVMKLGQWHTIMTLYAYVKFQIKISDSIWDMLNLHVNINQETK
jgi:hypothetical protein